MTRQSTSLQPPLPCFRCRAIAGRDRGLSKPQLGETFERNFAQMDAAQKRTRLQALKLLQHINLTREDIKLLTLGAKGAAPEALETLRQLFAQQTYAIAKAGISAKQYSAALRNVPAQITNHVVSLQSGQRPLTVLLQQGGQLKDMFKDVVPTAKALGDLAPVTG